MLVKGYKGIVSSFIEDIASKNLAGTKIWTHNLSTRDVLTLPLVIFTTEITTFWLNPQLGPLN